MQVRLIDANKLMLRLQKKESTFFDSKRTEGFNDAILRVRSMVHSEKTVDPESLLIVQELRAQLARVTAERDKAIRHEHLDELKLCLESSQDMNLIRIPRLLAEKVAVEGMKLENELTKIVAERDALAANSRPVVYGEWIFTKRVCDADECNCSICGQILTTHAGDRMDFCPNCGADMRGKPNKEEE